MDHHRFGENRIRLVGHDSTTELLYSVDCMLNISNMFTCSGDINLKFRYLINNFVELLVHEYHVHNKTSASIQTDYFG